MKRILLIVAVISTLLSIVLNTTLFLVSVEIESYRIFLIIQTIGYVLIGISILTIIMSALNYNTTISDIAIKKMTSIVCVIVVLFGSLYSVITGFGKYAIFWFKDEVSIYDEKISAYYPYVHEGNNYPRLYGDKYGNNVLLEFQNNSSKNGYRAVFFESNDVYLNKRFKFQFNPFVGPLYDFNSDFNNVTTTKKFNISGIKVKVYIEDDSDKYYAALISDAHHTLYVQLSYPTFDEESLETFANNAAEQFELLTNTNIVESFEWDYF